MLIAALVVIFILTGMSFAMGFAAQEVSKDFKPAEKEDADARRMLTTYKLPGAMSAYEVTVSKDGFAHQVLKRVLEEDFEQPPMEAPKKVPKGALTQTGEGAGPITFAKGGEFYKFDDELFTMGQSKLEQISEVVVPVPGKGTRSITAPLIVEKMKGDGHGPDVIKVSGECGKPGDQCTVEIFRDPVWGVWADFVPPKSKSTPAMPLHISPKYLEPEDEAGMAAADVDNAICAGQGPNCHVKPAGVWIDLGNGDPPMDSSADIPHLGDFANANGELTFGGFHKYEDMRRRRALAHVAEGDKKGVDHRRLYSPRLLQEGPFEMDHMMEYAWHQLDAD
jgi:hypothetical protein